MMSSCICDLRLKSAYICLSRRFSSSSSFKRRPSDASMPPYSSRHLSHVELPMPYLRQRSFTGIPASASFKIATIWLSVMRLLIVKLLCFSLKEILRVGCIILRGSYNQKPTFRRFGGSTRHQHHNKF